MFRLSMTIRSPVRIHGTRRPRTNQRKVGPATEPGWVISFGFFPSRMAPMIEMVFHERKGHRPTTR